MLAEFWREFHVPLALQIRVFWTRSWNIDPRYQQLFGCGVVCSCLKYSDLMDFSHRKGHWYLETSRAVAPLLQVRVLLQSWNRWAVLVLSFIQMAQGQEDFAVVTTAAVLHPTALPQVQQQNWLQHC